jgi:hypothetical protein
MNTVFGQHELSNLVGVRHAARLEYIEPTVALSVRFQIAQQEPGVHLGRNSHFAQFGRTVSRREAGEHGGDLTRLEHINQARHH